MVCMLVARMCGGINEATLRYAAAAEILHNATLMHDDVVDKSEKRRGAPTLASLIGPTAAVLVGDFWLAKAVELVVKKDSNNLVINQFSKTLRDLSEGEMLQLQNAGNCCTTEEDYLKVIYCKTGSLFETSCICGALSVGADDSMIEAVRKYSVALGNAFQIKDDILDYVGDNKLGKPVGADLLEQKITLPLIGAMKNAPEKEEQIRSMVREIPSKPELVARIQKFVSENNGVQWAAERLNEFISDAERALDGFEDSPQKDYLVQIARYNAFRTV